MKNKFYIILFYSSFKDQKGSSPIVREGTNWRRIEALRWVRSPCKEGVLANETCRRKVAKSSSVKLYIKKINLLFIINCYCSNSKIIHKYIFCSMLLTLDEKDPRRLFEGSAILRQCRRIGVLDENQMKLDFVLSLSTQVLFIYAYLEIEILTNNCFCYYFLH